MFHNKSFAPRAPVNQGDEIEVTIDSVGEKGDGIAKVKGFVVFVPGVKQGDTIKVRITKVLKKFAFGEVAGKASSSAPQSSDEEGSREGNEGQEDENFEENSSEDSEDFGDEEEKM